MHEDQNSFQRGYHALNDEEQRNRMIRRSFAKANKDYINESNSPNDFYTWMEITYGIKFYLDTSANILITYNKPVAKGWEVVDEIKFLAYYLKYQ